jgi:hypothetical protein
MTEQEQFDAFREIEFPLRDLFALEAMKIILGRNTLPYSGLGELSYKVADEMIAARDKQDN